MPMEDFETFWQAATSLPAVEGGVSITEILAMPPTVASLLRALNRSGGASLDGLAGQLGFDREQARQVSRLLVERGYLFIRPAEADAPPVFRVCLARTKQHKLPL
jgi:hypothetical protein